MEKDERRTYIYLSMSETGHKSEEDWVFLNDTQGHGDCLARVINKMRNWVEGTDKLPCVGVMNSQLGDEELIDVERGKMGKEELANCEKKCEKCRSGRTK